MHNPTTIVYVKVTQNYMGQKTPVSETKTPKIHIRAPTEWLWTLYVRARNEWIRFHLDFNTGQTDPEGDSLTFTDQTLIIGGLRGLCFQDTQGYIP